MRNGILYFCLLLLCPARAQFFQYGIQGGFLGKQTVVFKEPVVLDSGVIYKNAMYALGGNLQKTKNNYPVSLDSYVNYHFNKNFYIGFSHRYLKHASYPNGDHDEFNPSIFISAHAFGLSGGYALRKDRFIFFAETGLAATRLKFKYGWTETDRNRIYGDYLDKKNTFLMGFGKIGFTYMAFSLSTRMDFKVADIRNKSGIKTLKYTPTLNIGFHVRSGTVGKRKFSNGVEEIQLQEDVSFKESFEFPRLSAGLGYFADLSRFRPVDTGPYAYFYQGKSMELKLKKQWLQVNFAPLYLIKYAPFKNKHFIVNALAALAYQPGDVKIGTLTTRNISSGGEITADTEELEASFANYQFIIGAGYQFKITDIAYIEITPHINFITSEVKNLKSLYSDFFRWKKGFTNNIGLNATYVRRHWGISLRSSFERSSHELNDRLKPMQYYSISILRYVPILF
jgi:hypothetical protein